jgi:cellobiose-specific phosphotransferase system component IIC
MDGADDTATLVVYRCCVQKLLGSQGILIGAGYPGSVSFVFIQACYHAFYLCISMSESVPTVVLQSKKRVVPCVDILSHFHRFPFWSRMRGNFCSCFAKLMGIV